MFWLGLLATKNLVKPRMKGRMCTEILAKHMEKTGKHGSKKGPENSVE